MGAVVIMLLYLGCYLLFLQVPMREAAVEVDGKAAGELPAACSESIYREKEKLVLAFIRENMLGANGEIFTNLQTDSGGLYTLSESVGLLLDYCVLRGERELFDKEYAYLKSSLLSEGQYIRWKSEPREISCNAAIDDLRIIRALINASELWGETEYMETAVRIQEALLEKQAPDGYLADFYEWGQKAASKRIPLCYLDLYTMRLLEDINPEWGSLENRSRGLLKKGRGKDASPVFYKFYDYEKRSYARDEEYASSRSICLTYTLYTALHLAEVGEDTLFLADWLERELSEKGKLGAWYDPVTLKPVNGMESTAVYALAAVYAKTVGRQALYHSLLDHMLGFMVKDSQSRFYGGFGIEETGEFFSFDNLTALWALAHEDEE